MLTRKTTFSYLLLIPVLLTPFIYSSELYNGIISAKQVWFCAAMILLMTSIGLYLLITKRPIQITLNRVDLALLLFYCYLTIRTSTTPYMPILYNTRYFNYSLCVVLYFIIKNWVANEEKERKKTKGLNELASDTITYSSSYFFIVYFLILTGLGQAIWGLFQLYGILPSFNSNFKITGTFYNPAPYALYLSVIFPMALGTYLFSTVSDILKKYLSLITIIAILFVLPVTMIRAAWLSTLVGSLVVLQYKYQFIQTINKSLNTRVIKITALAVIITVVVSLVTGLYLLKKDSANGKLFIWEVTLGKIAEKPLFGCGLGRFEAEYNNWQAEYFQKNPKEMDGRKGWVAGNIKYAFNEFLEMTSETGIVGLLLFLSLIVSVYYGIPIDRVKDLNYIEQLHTQTSSFTVLIICMAISYPLFSLPTFILFFVMLAMGSAFIRPLELRISSFVARRWSQKLIAIGFLGTFVGLVVFAKRQYKDYYYWNEAYKLYNIELYSESCLSLEKVSNQMQYNGSFLRCQGKSLYLDKQYAKSAIILKQAQNYISDVILYTTLGDNYKALKQYGQSELSYQYASAMSPNKLYPLCLLAKLYDETGQKENAVQIAKKLLEKEVKIESPAINEIREEMKTIIESSIKNLK